MNAFKTIILLFIRLCVKYDFHAIDRGKIEGTKHKKTGDKSPVLSRFISFRLSEQDRVENFL